MGLLVFFFGEFIIGLWLNFDGSIRSRANLLDALSVALTDRFSHRASAGRSTISLLSVLSAFRQGA